jgi:hypothetical protein
MSLKITNIAVYGTPHALRGLRRFYNSNLGEDNHALSFAEGYQPSKNELAIMKTFVKAGPDKSKFNRFILVYADIVGPRYWWIEFKSYRAGVELLTDPVDEESFDRPLTIEDFVDEDDEDRESFQKNIAELNVLIEQCHKADSNTKTKLLRRIKKRMPSGRMLGATVMLSYQAIRNMYIARKAQKSEEWTAFFKFTERLPNWENLIAGKD